MTPPTKLSKDILSKIEDSKMAPKPRWHFLLQSYVLWITGVASVVIGGAAVSVIIYMLQNNDWDLFTDAEGRASLILSTLPYFWAVILAIMVGIALYNVKHSKTGYKYHAYTVVLGSIVASCVLGVVLYSAGAGKTIDRVLEKEVGIYSEWFVRKAHHLTQPEQGRLAGVITSVDSDENFIIIDIYQTEWQVITDLVIWNEEDKEELEEGHLVLIQGNLESDNTFTAYEIRIKDDDEPFGHKDRLPRGPFGDKDGKPGEPYERPLENFLPPL